MFHSHCFQFRSILIRGFQDIPSLGPGIPKFHVMRLADLGHPAALQGPWSLEIFYLNRLMHLQMCWAEHLKRECRCQCHPWFWARHFQNIDGILNLGSSSPEFLAILYMLRQPSPHVSSQKQGPKGQVSNTHGILGSPLLLSHDCGIWATSHSRGPPNPSFHPHFFFWTLLGVVWNCNLCLKNISFTPIRCQKDPRALNREWENKK